MQLNKVRRKRAYMEIVDQIRYLISRGEVKLNDRLPTEQELSLKFGVARPTVREALSALEVLGLVEVRVGSGAYIVGIPSELPIDNNRSLDVESPLDLYEIRMKLEPLAAAKAALSASDEDIQAIEKIIRSMERKLKKREFSFALDRKFHYTIAKASGNEHLVQVEAYIIRQMRKTPYLHFSQKNIQVKGHIERVIQDHRSIFEAIRDKSYKRAESMMLAHLNDVAIREGWV
jgi:GntR family transcriptional repressor for pyruvate dehydrogenase complex